MLNAVSGQVRHAIVLARQLEEGRRDTGLSQAQVEQDYGRALAWLVDPNRFPDAAKLFAADVFEPHTDQVAEDPADHDFTFGLELLLDGIAAAIDRMGRAVMPGPRPPTHQCRRGAPVRLATQLAPANPGAARHPMTRAGARGGRATAPDARLPTDILRRGLGWQGLQLPRLPPHGPVFALVVTGVVVALWHPADAAGRAVSRRASWQVSIKSFLVTCVQVVPVFTWLRSRSASVVPAAVANAFASTAALELPWVFAAADRPPNLLTAGLDGVVWLAMAGFRCVLWLPHTTGRRSAAGAVAGTAGDFGATGSTWR